MLENPSDESVVRWGDNKDSFVVLEVRLYRSKFRNEHQCVDERRMNDLLNPSVSGQWRIMATLSLPCGMPWRRTNLVMPQFPNISNIPTLQALFDS